MGGGLPMCGVPRRGQARGLWSGQKQRLGGRAVRCLRGQVAVSEAVPPVPNS